MLFIVVLTRVICAAHEDVDVVLLSVLLSEICKGYIIIYYSLYFVCFYVNLIFIYTCAVGYSTLPE
jgi:hypothetical protein